MAKVNLNKLIPSRLKQRIKNIIIKRQTKNLILEENVEISFSSVFKGYNKICKNSCIYNSEIGFYTYVSKNCEIANTTIGNFCSIGPNVKIAPGIHPVEDFVSTHPIFYSSKKQCGIKIVEETYFQESIPTKIGSDVWIGANSIIMDGINVGNGAIIGAGSIVTRNVADYAVVGGVPAKLIKKRFDETTRNFLSESHWWAINDLSLLKNNNCNFRDLKSFKSFIQNINTDNH